MCWLAEGTSKTSLNLPLVAPLRLAVTTGRCQTAQFLLPTASTFLNTQARITIPLLDLARPTLESHTLRSHESDRRSTDLDLP